MFTLVLSNVVHDTCQEDPSNVIPKPLHTRTDIIRWVENLTILESSKIELVEGDPQFPIRRCKKSVPTFTFPGQVPKESSCRSGDTLFHHREHTEKASVHVFLQDNKSTSAKTTRLSLASCLFSKVYGQHVVQLMFLTSYCFSDKCVFNVSGFANMLSTSTSPIDY